MLNIADIYGFVYWEKSSIFNKLQQKYTHIVYHSGAYVLGIKIS